RDWSSDVCSSDLDVHTRRGHDDIFFSALKVEIAFCIQFPDIPSVIPTFFGFDGLQLLATPVSRRYAAAAHQNLTIRSELHFAPGKHFANGAFSQAERMIHADE